MASIIAKLYSSADKAAAAVKELKNLGYGDSDVTLVAPSGVSTAEEVAAGIAQAGVSKADAAVYAAEVKKGATLVAVSAAFGAGVRTTAALDKHEPLPSPIAPAPAPVIPSLKSFTSSTPNYDEAAPLSSMMQWKTSHTDSTPFSNFLNFPTLSDFSFSRKFGFAELSDDAAPLSKRFGWPLLRDDDPTPLSKKFNWPVLRD